jgi:preflagellin peptidase FlaK
VVLLLDLLRLLLGAAVLCFAAFTDWRWRRAPNVLWIVVAAVGVALLLIEAALDPAPLAGRWPYLLGVPVLLVLVSASGWMDALAGVLGLGGAAAVVAVERLHPGLLTPAWGALAAIPVLAALVYVLWWFGLIAGGADAKALIALAALLPWPLRLDDALPLLPAPLPGSFSVLADSLLLFLLIPLGMLVWNVAHGDVRLPHALLGVKREARLVRRGHQWPLETVTPEGARRTRLFASRMSDGEIDETFERVQSLGSQRVWVTPKVPFMIPLLAGFLCAFTVGDLLFALLSRIAR